MTKMLYLLRHGKSDWSRAVSDFERPLKKRGKDESRRLGLWLRENHTVPDLVITSTARRARHTAELACAAMDIPEQHIQHEEDLYMATEADLMDQIRFVDETVNSLMLVGHNPGMEYLLLGLLEGSSNMLGLPKILPTATVAALEVEGDWRDMAPEFCKLKFIQRGMYS